MGERGWERATHTHIHTHTYTHKHTHTHTYTHTHTCTYTHTHTHAHIHTLSLTMSHLNFLDFVAYLWHTLRCNGLLIKIKWVQVSAWSGPPGLFRSVWMGWFSLGREKTSSFQIFGLWYYRYLLISSFISWFIYLSNCSFNHLII